MYMYKILCSVTIILFLIGCSKSENDPTYYTHTIIELEKTGEFILSGDNVTLGRIETPAIVIKRQGSKKILFYDAAQNQILIADTMGFILQTIGSVGSGPEEFRHITSFGIDKDTIIVTDGSLDLVKKFTLDGTLIGMHESMAKDNLWPRSNRLYATNDYYYFGVQESDVSNENNHWKSKIIAKYTKNGTLVDVFGSYHPSLVGSGLLYNYANLLQRKDGDFYTTHRTSYQIQRFSGKNGTLVSSFGVLSPYFKQSDERPNVYDSREEKNKINTKYSGVDDAFVSKDYLAFHFFNIKEEYWVTRDPNDQENFFQIYDLNDKYVGDIILPYYPLSMDNDNVIYLLEDDNPDQFKVGMYEMVF